MWTINLPDRESHLLLTPRWAEWGPLLQWGALLLVGLGPLLLAAWLYRRELRLLPSRVAWGLLALRLLAVSLVWFLLALQPVLVHTTTEEVPGYVLVALDRSASMEFADPDLTRTESARRILSGQGLGLLPRLRAKHQLHLIAFDKDTWDIDLNRVDNVPRAEPGAATNLRAPLARALERSGTQPGRTLGVILVTDGRHTWGTPPGDLALALGERGIPIFPIALGAKQSPPDVALLDVQAPGNVFKNVDAEVRARIRVSGLPAQELIVELLQDGKVESVDHVQRLRHDGGERTYTVTFPIKLERVGVQPLQVKVRTTAPGPAEITLENNQRTVPVRVTEDRARVLLIDGEAGWEYQSLANALGRDPAVILDRVVCAQPRLDLIEEAALEKAGHPRLKLPVLPLDKKAVDPLLKYDCILLGDVTPEQLPFAERRRLEKYVAERGGTLIVAAGKRAMPLQYLERAQQAGDDDPLLRLLPIEQPQVVALEKGFAFTLTAAGISTPFLQLDADRTASQQRWAELPKHFWAVAGKPKPGATALARLVEDEQAIGNKEDKESKSILVEQKYGFGRVVYLGLNSTWRSRSKVADKYQHRFWGQLIRWAAVEQLLPAGNAFVRYGSLDAVYRQDQEIPVQLRLLDEETRLPPGAFAGFRLFRQTGGGKETALTLIELRRSDKQPQTLEATLRPLPPGTYRLEPVIPELQQKLAVQADDGAVPARRRDTFTVMAEDAGELADLSMDWEGLNHLASVSGGAVFTPETAADLIDRLVRAVETRQQRQEQALWQDPPLVWVMLGLLVSLLTLEWVGRKWVGLL